MNQDISKTSLSLLLSSIILYCINVFGIGVLNLVDFYTVKGELRHPKI